MELSERILIQPPSGLPRAAVERYLHNCRGRLPGMRDAIDRLDFESLRVYGHGMKGAGAPYGFPKLTELGAAIERAAKAGDGGQLRHCAAALEAYLAAVELQA